MMTCRHHLLAAMSLVIIFLTFLTLPLAAQGTCFTPLPHPPHQGGGKSASAIYGLQAVISKGTPVLGCQSRQLYKRVDYGGRPRLKCMDTTWLGT